MMNGYHILGGVPPFQVLQQQNAGLPPGSVPPWYAMQYPAGYVPPLLVSVDNPMEPDAFDAFDEIQFRGERDRRDLARSGLQPGWNAPTYIGDLADYSYGEKQVLELVAYFDAVHRPKKFEPAVEAVYAAYENTRTSFATLAAFTRDKQMKQIGADASDLMKQIATELARQGNSQIAPSGASSAVYKPTVDTGSTSWWWYAIIGIGVVGVVGYFALPVLAPMVVSKLSRTALARHLPALQNTTP